MTAQEAYDRGLAVSLVINLGIIFVCWLWFEFFRSRIPSIYSPNCFSEDLRGRFGNPFEMILSIPSFPPGVPTNKILGWIRPTIHHQMNELSRGKGGLDAVMYIHYPFFPNFV
jgi:hypothetical protein